MHVINENYKEREIKSYCSSSALVLVYVNKQKYFFIYFFTNNRQNNANIINLTNYRAMLGQGSVCLLCVTHTVHVPSLYLLINSL